MSQLVLRTFQLEEWAHRMLDSVNQTGSVHRWLRDGTYEFPGKYSLQIACPIAHDHENQTLLRP